MDKKLKDGLEIACQIANLTHEVEKLKCEKAIAENRVKFLHERNLKHRETIGQLENEIDDKNALIVETVKLKCCATCGYLEREGLQYPVCMLSKEENEINNESHSCEEWFFRELKHI